jgi:hypothetical protein
LTLIQLLRGDRFEKFVVDLCRSMRLSFRGDTFAQRIECDEEALAVEFGGHAQSVADLHSVHEARAHAAAEFGVLAEVAQGVIAG